MENAQWNGSQMLFGNGMATADDIVAHEYTHALIDNIGNGRGRLLLTGQSGALAEAFADIFGEVVDLTQATGNDTNHRKWDIGEAATGGPFRNLLNPNAYGQPGKVTDPKFYCGADDDAAIHINSGVLSHAFALLVDGGSYNGMVIPGIGIDKTARVFYKALTERLVSTSQFSGAYQALLAAADDLVVANVLSAGERKSLSTALAAVELNVTPCSVELNYCPAGRGPAFLFSDNFENTVSGNWANSTLSNMGVNHWVSQNNPAGIYRPTAADVSSPFMDFARARSGNYALWAENSRYIGVSPNNFFGDSAVAMTNAITVPASGPARGLAGPGRW